MFSIYILYSAKLCKFYTGQTEDLERRLMEHNHGKSAFMARGMPWKLIWHTNVSSRKEAMSLEKTIKKRGAQRFLNDHQIGVE
jgi:putative endonuclease